MYSNGQQGGHFHTQLTGYLEKIIQETTEYVMKRTMEKTELLNKISMQSFGSSGQASYGTGAQPTSYGSYPGYSGAGTGYPQNAPQTYTSGTAYCYSGAPQGYYQNYQAQGYPSSGVPNQPQGQPHAYPGAPQGYNYSATGGYPGAPGGPAYPGTSGYGYQQPQQPRPGYPRGYGY